MEQKDAVTASLLFSLLLPALLLCVLIPTILVRRARLRLPPGPPGLPLLGHLHLLGSNPHCSLSQLSKRYGPLMFLRFGSVPVVVASSPATTRLILQKHDQIFSWRPRPAVPMHLHECKDILFSQPGPYLKLIRQLAVSDLFGSKRLQSFRPLIAEETRGLLRSVADSANKGPLRAKLYDATLNIISRMTISKKVKEMVAQSQADPSENLVTVLLEMIHLLGVFNVGDYIPFLAWMDLQGCVRRSKKASRRVRAVWQAIMSERREARARRRRGNRSEDVDFLDVLLTASEQEDVQITDLHIMAILTDLFGGGIDTSTVTVEWALAELLRHPSILKKAQEELDKAIGRTRLVREPDIPELPYLRAVVKEAMRLHPVLPLLVPHVASQQCQVSGYDVPSSTQAYVNVWAIGRDPTIWEKPLEFCPERFVDSNVDVRGQHFELLPFGSGRRACPGLTLGLGNVHLMLASLLHAFEWTAIGEIDLSEKFGIVMALEAPLVAKAVLRVPEQLIEAEACD